MAAIYVNGDSPEAVALELYEQVIKCEGKAFGPPNTSWNPGYSAADRKWILDTYAECLEATKGNRPLP